MSCENVNATDDLSKRWARNPKTTLSRPDCFFRRPERKERLECKKCKTVLGIYTIYQKENRTIYRLVVGAIEKKIIKGDKLGTKGGHRGQVPLFE